MNRPLLTPAARRHLARLARALTPHLARLDRDSTARLRQRPYDAAQIKAFLAITPTAFARLRSVRQFLEQVEYHGRRLAKLNVPPGEVSEMLRELESLLEPLVGGRFDPAREQLQLATMFALNHAFYQVREAESQAFFGVYRAEAEAQPGGPAAPFRAHPHPDVSRQRRTPAAAGFAGRSQTDAPPVYPARPSRRAADRG